MSDKTETKKEEKKKPITNAEAIEKITENFLKFLSEFKQLSAFAEQFKTLKSLPTQAKFAFVKKYLSEYESDIIGFIRYQVLEKHGLKESSFKEEDIGKLHKFIKAFIVVSK